MTWQDEAAAAGWTPPAAPPAPDAGPSSSSILSTLADVVPFLKPGRKTSEFVLTVVGIVMHAVFAIIVLVNPGATFTQTDQTVLISGLAAAVSWILDRYSKRRTVLKVAHVNAAAADVINVAASEIRPTVPGA